MRVGFVVAVWFVAFLVAVIGAAPNPLPGDLQEPAPAPLVVPVEQSGPAVQRQQVQVALTWDGGPVVRASGVTGRVSRVALGVGDDVAAGEVVLTVAGRDVVALISDLAPYRSLAAGDTGPDVAAAARMLVDAGFLEPATGPARSTVDWTMSEAIRAFNRAHGWQDQIRTRNGVVIGPELALEALAWGSTPIAEIRDVHVVPGTPAPADGEPVVQGAPYLTSARVHLRGGTAAPADSRATLIVQGVRVPLQPAELTVARRHLPRLGEHVPANAEEADGVIEFVTSRDALAVPVGAVTHAADGTACIRGANSGRWVEVEVVSSQFGQVLVRPSPHLPDKVIVDGAAELTTCAP